MEGKTRSAGAKSRSPAGMCGLSPCLVTPVEFMEVLCVHLAGWWYYKLLGLP